MGNTQESKEFINLDNRFFWKGNDNPCNESTPIWVPYDLSDNQSLETSYQNFIKGIKDKLILGDYSYDFKKWMQINIHDICKQRPIKRDLPSNITNIMRKNKFQELLSGNNIDKIEVNEGNWRNLLYEV